MPPFNLNPEELQEELSRAFRSAKKQSKVALRKIADGTAGALRCAQSKVAEFERENDLRGKARDAVGAANERLEEVAFEAERHAFRFDAQFGVSSRVEEMKRAVVSAAYDVDCNLRIRQRMRDMIKEIQYQLPKYLKRWAEFRTTPAGQLVMFVAFAWLLISGWLAQIFLWSLCIVPLLPLLARALAKAAFVEGDCPSCGVRFIGPRRELLICRGCHHVGGTKPKPAAKPSSNPPARPAPKQQGGPEADSLQFRERRTTGGSGVRFEGLEERYVPLGEERRDYNEGDFEEEDDWEEKDEGEWEGGDAEVERALAESEQELSTGSLVLPPGRQAPRVKSAVFVKSSSSVAQCPKDTKIPEFAVIGRSNVGKSSLINMLTNHKGLAQTSKKPAPRVKVKSAVFVKSSSSVAQCPKDTKIPEFAVIGRSNVGKSSLINMLTNHKGLAQTSKKPAWGRSGGEGSPVVFVKSSSSVAQCPKDTKIPEFAVIGRSNVGKSSLINMLTNHKGLAQTSKKPVPAGRQAPRVKSAVFVKSSSSVAQCPKDTKIPEFAVIGRSNVGKSSLINMLTNHKGLAQTSKKPAPRVKVKSAVFVKSSSSVAQCPKDTKIPEFAVIGRSNVGKSSLINMLTNHKGLAQTSKKPAPRVKSAVFVKSSSSVAQCPKDTKIPEFAVIGRSNVGKSSLINMLTDHKGLAQTSKKPVPQVKVKSAVFVKSSSSVAQCPKDTKIPEFAVIGRSNVGKSSLINMLTNHKGLAQTSKKPGE
ncbi:unnamed protein product [Closterium sp. Yama58-4]|nr:unnamed protein product [Closterium sp. Yama58-4]